MSQFKYYCFFFSPFIKLLWPTKVINKQNIIPENQKAVYICNHYSSQDATAMVGRIFKKDLNVVTKTQAFNNKIGGWFLKSFGCIPIRRGEPDMTAHKAILKVLKEGRQLLLFPEGTRNKSYSKEILPFKPGAVMYAIKTKSPIVPMLYYRCPKIFRKNYLIVGKSIDLSAYYGQNTSLIKNEVTDYVYACMIELRKELDDIVENQWNKKNLKR